MLSIVKPDGKCHLQAAKEKASQFEDESRRVKAELKDVAKTMSNENLSLTSEVARVREDFNREIESERKKHEEELRQINSNHELQKKKVDKVRTFLLNVIAMKIINIINHNKKSSSIICIQHHHHQTSS